VVGGWPHPTIPPLPRPPPPPSGGLLFVQWNFFLRTRIAPLTPGPPPRRLALPAFARDGGGARHGYRLLEPPSSGALGLLVPRASCRLLLSVELEPPPRRPHGHGTFIAGVIADPHHTTPQPHWRGLRREVVFPCRVLDLGRSGRAASNRSGVSLGPHHGASHREPLARVRPSTPRSHIHRC